MPAMTDDDSPRNADTDGIHQQEIGCLGQTIWLTTRLLIGKAEMPHQSSIDLCLRQETDSAVGKLAHCPPSKEMNATSPPRQNQQCVGRNEFVGVICPATASSSNVISSPVRFAQSRNRAFSTPHSRRLNIKNRTALRRRARPFGHSTVTTPETNF